MNHQVSNTETHTLTAEETASFTAWADAIVCECSKVIVGKEEVIRNCL